MLDQRKGPGLFDLVLVGGRVIDPETGLDTIAHVGVSGAHIVHVGAALPAARRIIDCSGLVVAPGFIDLHSHAQSMAGAGLQILDGVTTAVDLECGAVSVRDWYDVAATEGRPIHYGYSASWVGARDRAVHGRPRLEQRHETSFEELGAVIAASSSGSPLDDTESRRVVALLEEELEDGALGVGVLLGYLPESSPSELHSVAELCARTGTAAFVHSRSSARSGRSTALGAVQELIDTSEATGAHVHLCHVNSTSSTWMAHIVEAIEAARGRGTRITTECYPYARGSTVIGAAFLSAEELHREGREPSSLIYVPTGETVANAARLEQLREADPGGIVMTLTYDLDDEHEAALLDRALLWPEAAFASDAMPLTGVPAFAHPRTAGTFSRVFGWLVRERAVLTIPEAVRRCTLVPADILAGTAPMMASKGRIQIGTDADLTVFDPEAISDRSTYSRLRPSTGVRHVVVAGRVVVADGDLRLGVHPGRPIVGR